MRPILVNELIRIFTTIRVTVTLLPLINMVNEKKKKGKATSLNTYDEVTGQPTVKR